jgi:hypothetical protein
VKSVAVILAVALSCIAPACGGTGAPASPTYTPGQASEAGPEDATTEADAPAVEPGDASSEADAPAVEASTDAGAEGG